MLAEMKRAAQSEGMRLHPLKTRAFYIKGYGLSPDVVFDIGVYDGTRWLYRAFPDAQFVLVDPQPECAERIGGKLDRFDFHAVALGATSGVATLTVPETAPGKGGAMASLRRRTDVLADTFLRTETREVPVKRLDDLAAGYDGRVGIKIDTEGFEAEVLAGATDTLKRADFVILELSLIHRFEGVARPSRSIGLLADAGLEMRDVLEIADGPGRRARPRHMDVLFTRWAA